MITQTCLAYINDCFYKSEALFAQWDWLSIQYSSNKKARLHRKSGPFLYIIK